jgi:hypothetical protein
MFSVTDETFTVEPPLDELAAGEEPDEDEPDEPEEQAAAASTAAVPATANSARPRLGRNEEAVIIDGFLVLSGHV